MTNRNEPSYADLVHIVLKSAQRPLTFEELFGEVGRRRQVPTRDPKATVRNALSQDRQLVSLSDGRYGYLPHLLQGSLIRVPLMERKPAHHPLVFTEEARDALWPGFFAIQKRRNLAPVRLRLPSGIEVPLSLEFLATRTWGSNLPEGLRRYLMDNRAGAGDFVLIRAVNADQRLYDGWFESRLKQDRAAVARRNRELADAALDLLRTARTVEVPIWDLALLLLGRGFYRGDVAPDPLAGVLAGDARFVDAGWEAWVAAEAVTPKMAAAFQERKLLGSDLFWQSGEEPPDIRQFPAFPSGRYRMERALADLAAAIPERTFDSADALNGFIQDLLASGGPPHLRAVTPVQKAQDLVYDAWDAPGPADRIRLARQALDLSPDCADAYVLLAEETARSAQEAAALYARGVAAGERALGTEVFEHATGHFWGFIQTRPYMRARLGLAITLWTVGKRREAVDHLWEMLRLNPDDNQGVRQPLLTWLLEGGEDSQAEKLLDLYPDDCTAFWAYGRALHAFRAEGDTPQARKLLAEAEQYNPHVPGYLLGHKQLPSLLPDLVGFGDESEAVFYAGEQMAAWRRTRGALEWLAERSGATPLAAATYRGVGRNDPCPCDSGRKYKRCHGG